MKHFAFPYTMFSITYFALSKIRSPLIWKEWSITIPFFHLLLYPLLTTLQLSGIRLLSQSISSMLLMTPNDCFQISICDNFKTSLQVVFFKVWHTVILSQVHDIDIILPNLWLPHQINLNIVPKLLRSYIVLIWNPPAAQCTILTLLRDLFLEASKTPAKCPKFLMHFSASPAKCCLSCSSLYSGVEGAWSIHAENPAFQL